MRNIALTTAATALFAATSYGDVSYSMPGLVAAGEITQSNFTNQQVSVGSHWGYKITGFSYRLVPSLPLEGSVANSGKYQDENNNNTTRYSDLSVSVNGKSLISQRVSFSSLKDDVVSGTYTFSEAEVITFSEQDITFSISNTSDLVGDAGSYVIIHGEAIKSAPVPTGEFAPFDLEATDAERVYYAEKDTVPVLHYKINKIGGISTEPALEVPVNVPEVPKDNSGIGNNYNADGEKIMYDPDNKGQAKKYEDGGLIVPEDGELDIEGNGKKK